MKKIVVGALFWLISSANAESIGEYAVIDVAKGFESPWAMAFLPNGDILITERAGLIKRVHNGQLQDGSISGVPEVYYAGQGGLLDIMLDRNFAQNQKLYLSYSHGDRRNNATRLVSARLEGNALVDLQVLFTASPSKSTAHHFAGRIAQLSDGTLLLSVGDGFNYREQAQKLNSHLGKIVRIDQQGKAPADNPFINQKEAKPEIWSLGHRNQQALTVVDGVVYEHEHGPKGGDEVNIIKPGLNYGWPVITRGVDYSGAQITPYTEYEGMQQPMVDWTPSIAPSSMTHHNGDLYVTSLAERSIRRLTIRGGSVSDTGVVFPELNDRMRDIATGPDNALYVLTDGSNARLLKIVIAQ